MTTWTAWVRGRYFDQTPLFLSGLMLSVISELWVPIKPTFPSYQSISVLWGFLYILLLTLWQRVKLDSRSKSPQPNHLTLIVPWVEVSITDKIKQFLLSLLAITCAIHLFLYTPLAPANRFPPWFSFSCQQVFDKTEVSLLIRYRSGFISGSDKNFFQKARFFKILHFWESLDLI